MNERTQIGAKLISTHILLLPVLISLSFFISRDSFLIIAILQSALLILFFAGYWEFFGFHFRTYYTLLIEFLLFVRIFKGDHNGFHTLNSQYLFSALIITLLYLLYQLIKILTAIFKKEREAVEIEFPFRKGKYLITDGGNSRISRLMNYHYYSAVHKKKGTYRSMMFATDIVKTVNSERNFLPLHNEVYPVFGEKIFSPVKGQIVKVEDKITDNIPFCGSYPYNTGNTVVIRFGNKYLLLGHLKKESIKVKVNDSVESGDLIAEAGNSGFSERPHLHMQLIGSETDDYWKGTGISIQYRKKNLFKNRIIDMT
jgi:hypothetical protein